MGPEVSQKAQQDHCRTCFVTVITALRSEGTTDTGQAAVSFQVLDTRLQSSGEACGQHSWPVPC